MQIKATSGTSANLTESSEEIVDGVSRWVRYDDQEEKSSRRALNPKAVAAERSCDGEQEHRR